jgi:hypothetical protein
VASRRQQRKGECRHGRAARHVPAALHHPVSRSLSQ